MQASHGDSSAGGAGWKRLGPVPGRREVEWGQQSQQHPGHGGGCAALWSLAWVSSLRSLELELRGSRNMSVPTSQDACSAPAPKTQLSGHLPKKASPHPGSWETPATPGFWLDH